jgi:hypothetical protein
MLAIANRSIGTTFRGATQTGAHHYLGLAGGTPVGYIDCGTFDRCTAYDGEGPDGPIITETIEALTGSIAFVIDPTAVGFQPQSMRPDFEGMLYYRAWRRDLADPRTASAQGFGSRRTYPGVRRWS